MNQGLRLRNKQNGTLSCQTVENARNGREDERALKRSQSDRGDRSKVSKNGKKKRNA